MHRSWEECTGVEKNVQGGYESKNGKSRVVPIVQFTTYKYELSQQMSILFELKALCYFYNKTCQSYK